MVHVLAIADKTDLTIFLLVVAARLIIPLFIPRFPLPAILVALVLDAADQTIFQKYTGIDTSETGSYQSYDKALDIYYLTVAYTATMRNWGGGDLFKVGRFLWYYRLVGVMLFEATDAQARWLLLVFPNTFEYFFIAIEAFKLRRSPISLAQKQVILIAGAIWVFIKLPQEYWIHVAKLDFTNFAKETVFGVDRDDSFMTAFANRPLVLVAIIVAIAALLVLAKRLAQRLPAPQWAATVDADRQAQHMGWAPIDHRARPEAAFGAPFWEKVVLVPFVASIFANVLPGMDAGTVQIAFGVAFIIAVNTFLSEALARRQVSWRSTGVQFAVMALANLVTVSVYFFLTGGTGDAAFQLGNTLFLVGLLTLIVVLFDRYRDVGLQREQRPAVALAQ
jgi:hypothetical protein